MQELKIAIIGAGFMAKAHSMAYATMPMFFWPAPARPVRELLIDVNEESAADAAARYGWNRSGTDWREAVEDPNIDVIDIATPNHLHAEIAIAALQAGKHVISEKPLARGAEEAKAVYEAAQASDRTTMVAFNYRRTPAITYAKKLIDEGRIGKILNFRGTYLQDWSASPDSPLSWRFRKDVAGSGALGDIGTHVVDIARYLVGEVSAVSAQARTWITERPVPSGTVDKLGAGGDAKAPKDTVDVDDEVMTMLRFDNDAIGSIEATRNGWGRNNFLTFEIHGTEGSIAFDYEKRDQLQVVFASDDPAERGFRTIYTGPAHPHGDALWPIPALGIGYGETKIIETHDLFHAIVNGTPASPNFADGYQIEKIADAILESSNSGQWVTVDGLK
ncbi:dehydrogenase [Micrococcus sp. HMSC067E09]|uniref:Gfo/Idh/MocA family protein n=1 Tax=Micrococcus sp. HMSC067E09 TaxID=1739367 RepID=UPI0008A227D0|nr:Gfo/Idh/MocA family oxidoreductase [Micrococcus sp. HMSC067E09]OFR89548.1 dehydrogenase [Micrococcus sp. HMSC067E09]